METLVKMRKYWNDYTSVRLNDTVKKKQILEKKDIETIRHQKNVAKLSKRMKYWTETPKRYKFILAAV